MGAQRHQRGKPQYAGPYLRFSGRAGRRSVRFSLLSFCQTASAFRLICLFHTFFRCGVYRAMVFAPLRCPKLFCFPFACLWAAHSACFAHLLIKSISQVSSQSTAKKQKRMEIFYIFLYPKQKWPRSGAALLYVKSAESTAR